MTTVEHTLSNLLMMPLSNSCKSCCVERNKQIILDDEAGGARLYAGQYSLEGNKKTDQSGWAALHRFQKIRLQHWRDIGTKFRLGGGAVIQFFAKAPSFLHQLTL